MLSSITRAYAGAHSPARMRTQPIQLCSRDTWERATPLPLASFAMAYAVRTQKDYDQLAKSKRKAA